MKHVITALALAIAVSRPAGAELKYTTHLELKKAEAASAPDNPILAMIGAGITRQLLPNGPADLVYVIGDKGTRTEFLQAAMGLPAGTVMIARADGALFVLNPAEKTYWKSDVKTAMAAMQSTGAAPEVNARRTGELSAVAGVKCERVTFDWKMNLPIPEEARATMPPGFPTTIAMSGDGCTATDQYQKYADLARKAPSNGMMSMLGMDKLAQGGILLRQNIRIFGVDFQSLVTEIAEVAAPSELFEVPEGYKEVPPPGGMK